ncbi:MAG: type III glutamate--ammonia ligase [Gammaproteobacteria bacterium]|nr:type III glutamate--ammonia ligase [Gammaproteobacteria bacterium]
MNLKQAQKFLKDHDIRYVLAQFVDVHGVAKTKSVPVSHFEDILTSGAGFAGFAIWGMGMAPHDPDYIGIGDLSTLSVVPWQPGYARIVCDGRVRGKPYAFDTRHVLKQVLAATDVRGWTVNVGVEPEFMVLRKQEDGTLAPADDSDTLEKPCYDYKGLSRGRAFIERLVGALQTTGFDVYQIDHEDANGQFEINYTYADALTAADRFVFFRMAAGEIAREMDLVCSFMPKPFRHRTGSGLHMHLSLSGNGKPNLFHDDKDKHGMGLSRLGYQFLGGLLKHARGLCALLAPSVNSYKRLVVGESLSGATWAPAYITFGDNNRTSMIRIPYGRLECRLADPSCNPYLAMAAVVAAGMDGVEHKMDPGPPQNENLYELSRAELRRRGIGLLPQNLGEALDALEADPLFSRVLGAELIQEFLKVKRMEWVEYSRHVSDWELNRYLEFY